MKSLLGNFIKSGPCITTPILSKALITPTSHPLSNLCAMCLPRCTHAHKQDSENANTNSHEHTWTAHTHTHTHTHANANKETHTHLRQHILLGPSLLFGWHASMTRCRIVLTKKMIITPLRYDHRLGTGFVFVTSVCFQETSTVTQHNSMACACSTPSTIWSHACKTQWIHLALSLSLSLSLREREKERDSKKRERKSEIVEREREFNSNETQ